MKFEQRVFAGHAANTYSKSHGEEGITEFRFLRYRIEQNWTHRTINLVCITLVIEKMKARHKLQLSDELLCEYWYCVRSTIMQIRVWGMVTRLTHTARHEDQEATFLTLVITVDSYRKPVSQR